MITMNVIGAGAVGATIAKLMVDHDLVTLGGIVNRSIESAQQALTTIGAGTAVESVANLPPADVYLVGTSDDSIEAISDELASTHDLQGSVVFHCSGSLPSTLLSAVESKGARVASVHPVKSFADVESSVHSFSGTYCCVEGDSEALDVLGPLFTALGANIMPIDPAKKVLYHTGFAFSMNYFVALVDIALRCYEKAGIERESALKMIQPLLAGAATNVVELGPPAALTGPIARGDVGVVQHHMAALGEWNKGLQELYAALGREALSLSKQAGKANPDDLERIATVLSD